MPLTPVRRRLRARVLEILPLPLALCGAIGIAVALQNPLALVLGALLLHQPHLGNHLHRHSTWWLVARQTMRVGLLATTLFLLPRMTTAASWPLAGKLTAEVPPGRLLLVAGITLGIYGLLFIVLRALLRRGHFATRLVVVGPPTAVASVATRLRESPHHSFQVLGAYDEAQAEDLQRLLALGQKEWLDAIVVARHSRQETCSEALRHQLRHLSAPIALVTPSDTEGQWLFVDDLDLDAFRQIAGAFGQDRYGFVVTPNADHLVRLHEDAAFRRSYASADFVLLDSRFLARWLHWTRSQRLRVCPGSDLTAALFTDVITRDDRIVVVGGTAAQAQQLREQYGLRNLRQLIPPMGFIHDADATVECLEFIERHSPFRFCLLAVGAPQQERIAALLKERGRARGLALCVGASLNFLTGNERRAPLWMQRAGLEWLYRLAQDPRRLAVRYLWRGPRVFGVLSRRGIVPRKRLFTISAAIPDVRMHRSDTSPPANRRQTG